MARRSVAIIGGGVIGCSLAWRLATRGCDVTVFEKGELCQEASWAAGGILSPHIELSPGPLLQLGQASLSLYPSFLSELSQTSKAPSLSSDGLVELVSEDEISSLQQKFPEISSWAPSARWCSQAELSLLEPALGSFSAGVFLPEERAVEPRLLCQALLEAARAAGVTLLPNTEVRRILHQNATLVGLDVGGEQRRYDDVILAAGSWSGLVAEGILPFGLIEPVRGQVLLLSPEKPLLSRVVYANGGYLVPRPNGQLLVGATTEHTGFEKAVTAAGVSRLLSLAMRTLPALSEAKLLDAWSGLRPGSKDGLPILGPSPIRGLSLATGHYRNGILLAPITASLMTSFVLGEPTSLPLSPFSVERFGVSL